MAGTALPPQQRCVVGCGMEWAGTPPWRETASDIANLGRVPAIPPPEDISIVAAASLDSSASADLHHLLDRSGDGSAGEEDAAFHDAVGDVDVGDSNACNPDGHGTDDSDGGGGGPPLASVDLGTVDELWKELLDDPDGLTTPTPPPTTAGAGEALLDADMPSMLRASAALVPPPPAMAVVGVSSPTASPLPLAAVRSAGLSPPPLPRAPTPAASLPPRPVSSALPLPKVAPMTPASTTAAASVAATSVPPSPSTPLPWGLPLSGAVAGLAPSVVAAVASALVARGATARTATERRGALAHEHPVATPLPPSSLVGPYTPPLVTVPVAREGAVPPVGIGCGGTSAGQSAAPGGVVPAGAVGADLLGLPSCGARGRLALPYTLAGRAATFLGDPPPSSSAATIQTARAGASSLGIAAAADAGTVVMATPLLPIPAAATSPAAAAAGSWSTPSRATPLAAEPCSSPAAAWVAASARPCVAEPPDGLAVVAVGAGGGGAVAASGCGPAQAQSHRPAVAMAGTAAAATGVGTAVPAMETAAAATKPPPQRRRGSVKRSCGTGRVPSTSTTPSGTKVSSSEPAAAVGTAVTRKGGAPEQKGTASATPPTGEGSPPLPPVRMPEPMIRKHKKNASASRYCHLCGRTAGTATKAAANARAAASARAAAVKAGTTAGAAAQGAAAAKGGMVLTAASSNAGGQSSSAKAEGRGTSPATDEEGSRVVVGDPIAADAAVAASPAKGLPPLLDLTLSSSLSVPPGGNGGVDLGGGSVRSASITDLDGKAGSDLPATTPRRRASPVASSCLSTVSAGESGGVGSVPPPTPPLSLPDMVVCKNNRYGVCRKSTCASCFRLHGWDFAAAVAAGRGMADPPGAERGEGGGGGEGSGAGGGGVCGGGGASGGGGGGGWICTHCRHACPPTASCVTYGRTNGRRRVQGVTRRRLIQQALAAGEDASALLRAHGLG